MQKACKITSQMEESEDSGKRVKGNWDREELVLRCGTRQQVGWMTGWQEGRKRSLQSEASEYYTLYSVHTVRYQLSELGTVNSSVNCHIQFLKGQIICSTSSGRSNSRLYSWPGSSLYKSWEMLSLYEQPNCAILGPFFPVLTSDKRFSLEWIITMIDV